MLPCIASSEVLSRRLKSVSASNVFIGRKASLPYRAIIGMTRWCNAAAPRSGMAETCIVAPKRMKLNSRISRCSHLIHRSRSEPGRSGAMGGP